MTNNNYSNKNAEVILANVNACITELKQANEAGYFGGMDTDRMTWKDYRGNKVFKIKAVYDELSIFDWWNDNLSMSQLKQMKRFLEQAIKLGFTGYACFKVGARGCANGMWVHQQESTTGYSPDGDAVYHSFVAGDNYWDICINGEWQHGWTHQYKLSDIKQILAENA